MTATVRGTANYILNRVASEVGLDAVADPFSSTDKNFVMMKSLLNTAGEELIQLHPWNFLIKQHSITTAVPSDDGNYELPTDYQRMVNQTHWETTNQRPLLGPLSPQEWQWLTNCEVQSALDVSFRLKDGEFSIFPQPPQDGLIVTFEYITRNWVISGADNITMTGECVIGSDTPLYDRTLLSRMLKVKWLEAKSFDSTKAQADLNQCFALLTGSDKGSPILNAGIRRGRRFLGYDNIPEGNWNQ